MSLLSFLNPPALQDDFDALMSTETPRDALVKAARRIVRRALDGARPDPALMTGALARVKELTAASREFSAAARLKDEDIARGILTRIDEVADPRAANAAVSFLISPYTTQDAAKAFQDAAMEKWEKTLAAIGAADPLEALRIACAKNKAMDPDSIYRPRMTALVLDLVDRVAEADPVAALRGAFDAFLCTDGHDIPAVLPVLRVAVRVIGRAAEQDPALAVHVADHMTEGVPFRVTGELTNLTLTLEDTAARHDPASAKPRRRRIPDANML